MKSARSLQSCPTVTPPQIVDLVCVVGFLKMYNTIHEVFSK